METCWLFVLLDDNAEALGKGAVQGIKAADSCEDARKEHTSPDEATSLAAHSHERRRKEEEGGSHIYKQGSQQSADVSF